MNEGDRLANAIRSLPVQAGELALWWLGQHSWVMKAASAVIGLDLYLSPSPKRLAPPLLSPDVADLFTLFCCSHEHSDHLDMPILPRLAAANPNASFVVPAAVAGRVRQALPASTPVKPMRGDDAVSLDAITVYALPAAHELLDVSPDYGSRFLGFVVEADGVRVWHSGDTCNYEGLLTRLLAFRPLDVALVPINGRDAERLARGCIGNMTWQEAVDIVGLLAPRVAAPAHFGMFANNTEDPAKFVSYLQVKFPEQKTVVFRAGEGWKLDAAGAVRRVWPEG